MSVLRSLTVNLPGRDYPIFIGEQLLTDADLLRDLINHRPVLVVTNPTVSGLYLPALLTALGEDQPVEVIHLPDGEAHKTLETVAMVFTRLLEIGYHRDCCLLALGGGVIGDMTGFAAACYQRGVAFIQMPTTLLAQVDSSVGGKTGVNHPLGKNMIGAFHQPNAVVIDTATLTTLPDREYQAGMAEIIKTALLADGHFFEWLETHASALNAREAVAMSDAIHQSCQLKAGIVAQDETETGIRALLNLGHTFGHALETGLGYGHWLHGEAVAAGLVAAALLSEQRGWLTADDRDRIVQLLKAFHLPIAAPRELSDEQILTLMQRDKKAQQGRLRLILLKAIGQAYVETTCDNEEILTALPAWRLDR